MDSYKPLEEYDEWRPRPGSNMKPLPPNTNEKPDIHSISDIPRMNFMSDYETFSSASRFDRQYMKLGAKFKPEKKRIDYVLVHPFINETKRSNMDADDLKKEEKKQRLREVFENALQKDGFFIQKEVIGEHCYKKLHCSFKRLCVEAEAVNMEMPLDKCKAQKEEATDCCTNFLRKHFVTDSTVDYVSAQFDMDRIHLFKDYHDPTNFFRPAVRSMLVNHILINKDIRTEAEEILKQGDDEEGGLCGCWRSGTADHDVKDKVLHKIAFPYLKMKEVYTDSLILHEASIRSKAREEGEKEGKEDEANTPRLPTDPRRDLDDTWTKFTKFQPLWKIRDYFGEKIAFYFAWSGTLTTTLWLPMLLGFGIFVYGLVRSIEKSLNETSTADNATITEQLSAAVSGTLGVIKEAFDNEVTPYFALIICLWGTVFLEIWKQKNARLAYEWDVEEFEETEPDRPEFYGTKFRSDPVTKEDDWFYPLKRQIIKFLFSGASLMFMVCLVLGSVVGVIVYRVIASVNYCPGTSSGGCVLITTVASSVLNAVSILLLGKVYDYIARRLTHWENHRTQTMFDDALIIKLFAFQFANNYASCFYIAFFRGRFDEAGFLGLGPSFVDKCEGTCMSQLSFQILTLMITKPLPKLFSDVIIPFFKRKWRKRPESLRCKCRKNQVKEEDDLAEKAYRNPENMTFLEKELLKENLGDFTMGEYTEKIIQYGFLMLFAASFPLAPMFALLTNLIDIRVDAKRMLWWYRRPLAVIAEDIGTWYVILNFVNFVGVVSNGFLIAFTSSWGTQYDTITKLWIAIGFEHIVFMLKFLLAYLIPDVPGDVALAMRRRTHQLSALLDEDRKNQEKEFAQIILASRRAPEPLVYTEKPDSSEWYPTSAANEELQKSPKSRRRHRKHYDADGDQEDVTYNEQTEIRKMKKKRKKRHQRPEPDVLEETGHYEEINYPPDYVQDTNIRQPSIKIRSARGEELTEIPIRQSGIMHRPPTRLPHLHHDSQA